MICKVIFCLCSSDATNSLTYNCLVIALTQHSIICYMQTAGSGISIRIEGANATADRQY